VVSLPLLPQLLPHPSLPIRHRDRGRALSLPLLRPDIGRVLSSELWVDLVEEALDDGHDFVKKQEINAVE